MNAIILAAGLGSRFKDFIKEHHKSLLLVENQPNLERTIQFLKQANINDIYIVVGHNAHLFQYLTPKYGCHLIYNEKYREYNNIYSFFLAKDYFNESYIIDADVVLFKNIFLIPCQESTYFLIRREKFAAEWIPSVDEQGYIKEISVSKELLPSLLGVSFWKNIQAEKIKKFLTNYISQEVLINSSYYWDDIPRQMIKELSMRTYLLEKGAATELDDVNDYLNLSEKYLNKIN